MATLVNTVFVVNYASKIVAGTVVVPTQEFVTFRGKLIGSEEFLTEWLIL